MSYVYHRTNRYMGSNGKRYASLGFTSNRRSAAPLKKKAGYRWPASSARNTKYLSKPKFATVSYNRDIEKKYIDRGLFTNTTNNARGGANSALTIMDTISATSQTWGDMDFIKNANAIIIPSDLLKGLAQGTNASARIGNKVTAKYIKGAITFTAFKNRVTLPATGYAGNQHGEQITETPGTGGLLQTYQYLRTSFRVCIVKDLQVNSADREINYDDVFENGLAVGSGQGTLFGVHSELKIANMGRFQILMDKHFQLDADDPMKTIPFKINGSQIGTVRYNGPSGNALTDKGIYVVWAAITPDTTIIIPAGNSSQAAPNDGSVPPTCVMHSRFCFTDS